MLFRSEEYYREYAWRFLRVRIRGTGIFCQCSAIEEVRSVLEVIAIILCIGTENIFISPRLFFQDGRVPRRIFCEERIAIAFVIPGKPLSKKKIQY